MSASYQCPDCGQVIPLMGLDDGSAPRCPFCRGATRSGAPPAPAPITWFTDAAQPPPAWQTDAAAPPIVDEEPADLDIRRKDLLPSAARPAATGSWRSKHLIWPVIVVGIAVLRLFSSAMRHDPQPPPNFGQLQFPQPGQFQMPDVDFPQPGFPGALVDRAQWARVVPDDLAPPRLLVSGPDNPRIGVVVGDLASPEMLFLGFRGDTGEAAGRILWNTATRPIAFSLARDGTRLAVLLEDRGQRASRRFRLYALPGGEAVGKDWYPIPAVKGEIAGDLWFELLGPDQLLTVYEHRRCELWALPDGNRLWSVVLDGPATDQREIAISPDRRVLAASNAAGGFTFYDSASGEVRGRTRVLHGVTKRFHSCAFSPDGQHLGCLLTIAGDEAGPSWVRWTCPAGTETARWPVARGSRHATYWDDDHILLDSIALPGTQRMLQDTDTGRLGGTVDLEGIAALATTGQRLWYLCSTPPQRTELVSVERRLDPFRRNPVRFGAGVWRLTPQGIAPGP